MKLWLTSESSKSSKMFHHRSYRHTIYVACDLWTLFSLMWSPAGIYWRNMVTCMGFWHIYVFPRKMIYFGVFHPSKMCNYVLPTWCLTARTWKLYHPKKERIVFLCHPFFRGELVTFHLFFLLLSHSTPLRLTVNVFTDGAWHLQLQWGKHP